MNPRSTWTLVMVAFGLFAFIFFFERHVSKLPPPPGPLLPGLSLPAVTSIQVRPGEKADLIRAERTNNTWQLTHPVVYPADVQRVRLLLQALNSLTRQRQIGHEQLRTHANPQQEYGFDAPRFSLIIKQAGMDDHTLHIGHSTHTGDEVFVKVVGATEVFLVDAGLLQRLPRAAADWRDRVLLPLDESKIDQLAVTNGNGPRVMVFKRDGTNHLWRMDKPLENVRADSSRIDRFLRDLLSLRVSQFVNDPPLTDPATYGLRPAVLDLYLGQGTNPPLVVSFGLSPTNDSTLVYARRRDLPGVTLVTSEPVEPWKMPHENFRDRQLINLADTAVDRVEVTGEGPFTLETSSNQTWRVTAPHSLPADPELVRLLLRVMSDLRIEKFAREVVGEGEAPRFGLEPPKRSFVFSRADTNAAGGRRIVAKLDFGQISDDRELVYVRRADEAPIYAIRREQADSLPIGGWQFRDRNIWKFTTNEVSKVTVRHDGKMMEVLREAASGKWTLGPQTQGATNRFTSLDVDNTLDYLGQLDLRKYDTLTYKHRWLDHGPDAPLRRGITEKSMSIEIELNGEPPGRKLKVDLQKSTTSIWPIAATTLDGQVFVFEFPPGTFLLILNCLDPAPANW